MGKGGDRSRKGYWGKSGVKGRTADSPRGKRGQEGPVARQTSGVLTRETQPLPQSKGGEKQILGKRQQKSTLKRQMGSAKKGKSEKGRFATKRKHSPESVTLEQEGEEVGERG